MRMKNEQWDNVIGALLAYGGLAPDSDDPDA
jgi:hypothetical protein